ncbi:hypothetical protein evm_010087 [Chilo suppressalis]|nr:hypothetical protein evm_010087 [Chilo suppressalis]
MTHQNHQTNGASLEDCHTNFFALTELYGIKWRKLVWGESSGGGEGEDGTALADPVISSYARCLAGDILCVWRRVPAPQPPADLYEVQAPAPPPPLSLRAAKELWIFWYGEEPDLNGLVAPELIASQGDQGSWESGLSYECRSLLFKALHNLIERCLLSRDFVRLGKWFVQPYDGDEEDVGKSPWHLSFSFAFFLHGESTVCASVDVRQHPPVRTLTPKRLARLNANDHQPHAKVILAPFGLEGTVTGREWGEADAATARLLDAWRQLYPLEQGCGAVEVPHIRFYVAIKRALSAFAVNVAAIRTPIHKYGHSAVFNVKCIRSARRFPVWLLYARFSTYAFKVQCSVKSAGLWCYGELEWSKMLLGMEFNIFWLSPMCDIGRIVVDAMEEEKGVPLSEFLICGKRSSIKVTNGYPAAMMVPLHEQHLLIKDYIDVVTHEKKCEILLNLYIKLKGE